MGGFSARKALEVVQHVETIVGIELMAAAQVRTTVVFMFVEVMLDKVTLGSDVMAAALGSLSNCAACRRSQDKHPLPTTVFAGNGIPSSTSNYTPPRGGAGGDTTKGVLYRRRKLGHAMIYCN